MHSRRNFLTAAQKLLPYITLITLVGLQYRQYILKISYLIVQGIRSYIGEYIPRILMMYSFGGLIFRPIE